MRTQNITRKSRCAVMLTDMQIHVHCPSLNSPRGINLHFITVPLGCKCIKYSGSILKMQLSLEKICKTSPPRWIKACALSANYFSVDCLLNMNPKTFLSTFFGVCCDGRQGLGLFETACKQRQGKYKMTQAEWCWGPPPLILVWGACCVDYSMQ